MTFPQLPKARVAAAFNFLVHAPPGNPRLPTRFSWIVCKEDLILSKLEWAQDSLPQRQLADVENLIATGCDVDYLRQ